MKKHELQKNVHKAMVEVDRLFKLPDEEIIKMQKEKWKKREMEFEGTRDEALCMEIKEMISDLFHPGW
jgi:hypothetical protein